MGNRPSRRTRKAVIDQSYQITNRPYFTMAGSIVVLIVASLVMGLCVVYATGRIRNDPGDPIHAVGPLFFPLNIIALACAAGILFSIYNIFLNLSHPIRLRDVPGYHWVHEPLYDSNTRGLVLIPESAHNRHDHAFYIRPWGPPIDRPDDETVTKRDDRGILIWTSTPEEWIGIMTEALNDLNTATDGMTRLPEMMPGRGDGPEPLSVEINGDHLMVNGRAVEMGGPSPQHRLIGAVASEWISQRLQNTAFDRCRARKADAHEKQRQGLLNEELRRQDQQQQDSNALQRLLSERS